MMKKIIVLKNSFFIIAALVLMIWAIAILSLKPI